MKTRHWLSIGILGCAVILVASLPPKSPRLPSRDVSPAREWSRHAERLQGRIQHLVRMMIVTTLRDSLLAALPPPEPRSLLVQSSPDLSDQLVEYLETRMREHWRKIRGDAGPPVVISLSIDDPKTTVGESTLSLPSRNEAFYLLPHVHSVEPCLIVIKLSRLWLNRSRSVIRGPQPVFLMSGRDPDLGPCAFYSRFGEPGSQIATWMARQHYHLAAIADWGEPPSLAAPAPEPVKLSGGWFTQPPATALACAAGDRVSCRDIALYVDSPALHSKWRRTIVAEWPSTWLHVADMSPHTRPYLAEWPLGGREAHFLSDLVRAVGEDQFRAFWTSNAPVEQAFREATGRELGDWTYEWLTTVMGTYPERPLVPGAFTTFVLLVSLVGVGTAALVSTNRQVG